MDTPVFIIDETRLRKNCEKLARVKEASGCKVLLAQKAYSAFETYPIIAEYLDGTTASGLYEARLGKEHFGKETHVYSPAYKESELKELLGYADHVTFNSPTQVRMFAGEVKAAGKSVGMRVNPECSTQEGHEIYDPCAPFSRLGATLAAVKADEEVITLLDGLHFHTLCEQNADALKITLDAFDRAFGKYARGMKWINLGGGHHITRDDYDTELLIDCIKRVRDAYGCEVYLEPGEAVVLNAGTLVAQVLDVAHNGKDIALLDASAACHMPDVLEMPYRPPVCGLFAKGEGAAAKDLFDFAGDGYRKISDAGDVGERGHECRLAGSTCLAGDVIGDWSFDTPPRRGDRIVLGDMALYTMVKTNTFNGTPLPAIALRESGGKLRILRKFGYDDFKSRL